MAPAISSGSRFCWGREPGTELKARRGASGPRRHLPLVSHAHPLFVGLCLVNINLPPITDDRSGKALPHLGSMGRTELPSRHRQLDLTVTVGRGPISWLLRGSSGPPRFSGRAGGQFCQVLSGIQCHEGLGAKDTSPRL